MTLYIVLDQKNQKAILATSLEREAYKALDELISSGGTGTILSTDNVSLDTAQISMDYELACLEESVRTTLRGDGMDEDKDPARFEELVSSIAADAYRQMTHYDVDEEFAISESVGEYKDQIAQYNEKEPA